LETFLLNNGEESVCRAVIASLHPGDAIAAHEKLFGHVATKAAVHAGYESGPPTPLELLPEVMWNRYCPLNRLGEFVNQTARTCDLVVEQRTHSMRITWEVFPSEKIHRSRLDRQGGVNEP